MCKIKSKSENLHKQYLEFCLHGYWTQPPLRFPTTISSFHLANCNKRIVCQIHYNVTADDRRRPLGRYFREGHGTTPNKLS